MNHDPRLTARLPTLPLAVSGPGFAQHELPRPDGHAGGEAVAALRLTLLNLVRRDGRDLTARQLTAFMTVYLDAQVHTVSSMAELLKISRPGVTRILDRLAEYDLIERQEDREDRRRVLIRRTGRGATFMRELQEMSAASQQVGRA